MYSCWWTVTKNYRVKHFMVSILREFTVLLMLTHSLFTLCRCQIFEDCIPVVEQANSVIHSALDDPDIPLVLKMSLTKKYIIKSELKRKLIT